MAFPDERDRPRRALDGKHLAGAAPDALGVPVRERHRAAGPVVRDDRDVRDAGRASAAARCRSRAVGHDRDRRRRPTGPRRRTARTSGPSGSARARTRSARRGARRTSRPARGSPVARVELAAGPRLVVRCARPARRTAPSDARRRRASTRCRRSPPGPSGRAASRSLPGRAGRLPARVRLEQSGTRDGARFCRAAWRRRVAACGGAGPRGSTVSSSA